MDGDLKPLVAWGAISPMVITFVERYSLRVFKLDNYYYTFLISSNEFEFWHGDQIDKKIYDLAMSSDI